MSQKLSILSKTRDFFGPIKDTDYLTVAQNDLAVARIKLLEAQEGREYAEAMIQYHSQKIDRLTSVLQKGYTPPVAPLQQPTVEDTTMK